MLKREVTIGSDYVAKVSNRLVDIRILRANPRGGWVARNLTTGREINVRTAGKLRRPSVKPAPKATTPNGAVLVLGPNLRTQGETFHVHSLGCSDLQKPLYRGHLEHAAQYPRFDLTEICDDTYPPKQFQCKSGEYAYDFKVFPCVQQAKESTTTTRRPAMAEGTTSRRRSSNSTEDVKKGKTLTFELDKETKGAVRFSCKSDDEGLATINFYLRKDGLFADLGEPEELKVTLTAK